MGTVSNRELILKRLLALGETVTGFKTILRNEGLNDDGKKDCFVLLDGDEVLDLAPPSRGRGPVLMSTHLMRMTPQLFVLLKEARPQQVTNGKNVGEILNEYRDALINAIATDTQLATLLGSNGKVVYNGCETDLKSGSTLSGTMRMDFAFTIPLTPNPT